MSVFKSIQKAITVFIETNELGNSDVKKLNQILELLNNKGEISKEKVISVIAPNSKDSDANYRNFISRIKNGLTEAIANSEDEFQLSILKSIAIDTLKATATEESRLRFGATIPKELANTVRKNLNYEEENYIESQGSSHGVLKFFISYASRDVRDVNLFKERFEHLTKHDDTFIQWSMIDLMIGEDFDERIKKELEECNYGIALVSENFLKSDYIMNVELKEFLSNRKLIPVGLIGEIDNLLKVKKYDSARELFKKQLFTLNDRRHKSFFADCNTTESQNHFIQELIGEIKKRAAHDAKHPPLRPLEDKSIIACTRESEYKHDNYIKHEGEARCIENHLEKLNNKVSYDHLASGEDNFVVNKIDVQKNMYEWVTERDEPLYAILGDYGMGKTFNCRVFAKRLQEDNIKDPNKPAVVYIDLRDVDTFVEENGKKRQPYLDEIIQEVLRISGNDSYTAEEIIEQNKKGELVIVFDGLDEKLVHYTKDMQSKFLSELLKILTLDKTKKQKVLLSCRSHYFENASKENSF